MHSSRRKSLWVLLLARWKVSTARPLDTVVAAHDGAFFDPLILHRDISGGNVIITVKAF
jgi:hypothetical protein